MYYSKKCIVCDGDNLHARNAHVAPFITKIVFDGVEPKCKILCCRSCGMVSFDLRFDSSEVSRLYSSYRGAEYTRIREGVEPGYKQFYHLINNNPIEEANRIAFMEGFIGCIPQRVASVLDWGGERGLFVPRSFKGAKVYVYDVSDVEPLNSVVRLVRDDAAAPYDFIMCTHVLEHVSEPLQIAKRFSQLTRPGGYIYIEVPMDLGLLSYICVRGGLFLKRLPGKMHEHINYFTENSLVALVEQSGFQVINCRTKILDFGWMRHPVIGCLAQNPTEKSVKTYKEPMFRFLSVCFMLLSKRIHDGICRIYKRIKRS